MIYTREEKDWIEAEWAFHLHGRTAFLSREDFAQLLIWEGQGVAAEVIVNAMEVYFERRAKRPRPRAFVALHHIEKDVAKLQKFRETLHRANAEVPSLEGWDHVAEPLKSDPKARNAFEAWRRLQVSAPSPDSPGFLDHFDAERKAHRDLVALAESALGGRVEALKAELHERLSASKLQPRTQVWNLAWDHHWTRSVCAAWGIPS